MGRARASSKTRTAKVDPESSARSKKPGTSVVLKDRLSFNGQRFNIELFYRDEDDAQPRPYFGLTTVADGLLEALAELNEDFTWDTIIHEALHAAFATSNFKHRVRGKVTRKQLTPAQLSFVEEVACQCLAPAILHAFREAGWLRLPKLPRKPRHRKA